jgi:hypothetical protein
MQPARRTGAGLRNLIRGKYGQYREDISLKSVEALVRSCRIRRIAREYGGPIFPSAALLGGYNIPYCALLAP